MGFEGASEALLEGVFVASVVEFEVAEGSSELFDAESRHGETKRADFDLSLRQPAPNYDNLTLIRS